MMEYISPEELKVKLEIEGLTLLDVREPYELEICEIGGVHIPMAEVASRVSEFEKAPGVVVMCRSGKRAEAVANLLVSELNVPNVMILEGGILAWINEMDSTLEAY